MEEILKLENIVKHFGERRVLEGVNLSVRRGESVSVIGRSGAGKSTLLSIAGALEKPTSGSVVFCGREVKGPFMRRYRRDHVGFVFQDSSLIEELTAYENVAAAVKLSKSGADPKKYLEAVGLGDRGDAYPDRLSGGQRQRVSLARAMAKKPSLLLLDEPTEGLDGETGDAVMDLILEMCEKDAVTSLMVTHNIPYARRMNRVFLLEEGKLSEV